MNFKILNQLIRVWERVKGDTQTKIGSIILSAGLIESHKCIETSPRFELLIFSLDREPKYIQYGMFIYKQL